MKRHDLKGMSLKSLEIFEAVARGGSLADAARQVGLSASAASQQLRNLDAAMGTELVDHTRRPLALTPAGRLFLRRVETALGALRGGQRDVLSLDLTGIDALALGVIEDFENELTPQLTTRLAQTLVDCRFRLQTGASHHLIAQLQRRELDMAICAAPRGAPQGLSAYPLVHDPYILALPRGRSADADFANLADLAFLRRDAAQIMGQQIEDYLARRNITLQRRFEIDSNQSIMALVASGLGFTITTPLSLLRAARFADAIEAHPLPQGEGEARQIVLYTTDDWGGPIPSEIADHLRHALALSFLAPAHATMPWIADRFRLLDTESL